MYPCYSLLPSSDSCTPTISNLAETSSCSNLSQWLQKNMCPVPSFSPRVDRTMNTEVPFRRYLPKSFVTFREANKSSGLGTPRDVRVSSQSLNGFPRVVHSFSFIGIPSDSNMFSKVLMVIPYDSHRTWTIKQHQLCWPSVDQVSLITGGTEHWARGVQVLQGQRDLQVAPCGLAKSNKKCRVSMGFVPKMTMFDNGGSSFQWLDNLSVIKRGQWATASIWVKMTSLQSSRCTTPCWTVWSPQMGNLSPQRQAWCEFV